MKILSIVCLLLLKACGSACGQTPVARDARDTKTQEITKAPTVLRSTYSQELPAGYEPELVPDYFLLGTLSDYMGRFQYVAKEGQVDRYYPYERPLVDYLTGYIERRLRIQVTTSFEESGHSRMDSPELARILNAYYDHRGLLQDSIFSTEAQIYSFLLGNYYRYGQKLSQKNYKIQLSNTLKGRLLSSLLQKAGCDRILYKFLHNIPAQTIFYFTPSPKFNAYLNSLDLENAALRASFYESMNRFGEPQATELKASLRKCEKDEAQKIEEAFQ